MSVGFPLGLLALGALAPLVGAYFLRRRQQPRVVSALFLWKTPSLRAQAGPKLQRFSRESSLALELLAVCLATVFLADVRCGPAPEGRQLVVVVDGGLSMQARVADGRTVAEKVRQAVAQLAQSQGSARVTLVESGPHPTVLAGPRAEPTRALAALEQWSPSQPAHDPMSALLLARELAGGKGQAVTFFTDGPLPEGAVPPPEAQVVSLGEALDNVALVSAQRSDQAGLAQLTVRVANFSLAAVTVPVRVATADGSVAPRVERLELGSGQSGVVRLGLPTSAAIEVSIPDDALAVDGRVTLLPSAAAELPVVFLQGLDPVTTSALKRALAVLGHVSYPSAAELEKNAMVPLSFGPEGSSAWVTVGASPPLKSWVGPFFAHQGHPVLEDVQLAGVVWTGGASPPGRPLLTAGEVALASEEGDGHAHLNLELSRSNLQRSTAWPVLVGNLARQARLRQPGLPRRHLMLGEAVPVTTAPGSRCLLRGPGGLERAVLGVGAVSLPPLPVPGRWALLNDGVEVDQLAVLPLDPGESDLRGRGPYRLEASATPSLAALGLSHPRPLTPLVLLLLLLLLLVLLVDFWLTARERG